MALVASRVVDSSALSRIGEQSVGNILNPLIANGHVATCSMLDFEALYSARSPVEYSEIANARRAGFEYLSTVDRDWHRALEVQAILADDGRWREVGMSDLLIAAVCERNRVALLHYDSDFETIAEITGQDARWVVPRGSVA